jgi:hypothetical protein
MRHQDPTFIAGPLHDLASASLAARETLNLNLTNHLIHLLRNNHHVNFKTQGIFLDLVQPSSFGNPGVRGVCDTHVPEDLVSDLERML